jgi:hypothetical protein
MKYFNYYDLQEAHRKEISEFPIAYAFNKQQLEEALAKLGAPKEECVTIFGHGDIVKKTDAKALLNMLERHTQELHEALKEDKEWAENAFLSEMDNHEYAINMSGDEDIFNCFAIDEEKLKEWGLEDAYHRARNLHMKRMHNLGVI